MSRLPGDTSTPEADFAWALARLDETGGVPTELNLGSGICTALNLYAFTRDPAYLAKAKRLLRRQVRGR
ncbi:hypothetical protein ABW16_01245 [Mycolicibacter heraklionensis]|uniref:Uncharacterized protein n=1 Tax=Mycolicibacter heraklionensis TaxID=512402 RepID=A0ABR5FKD8_9MYCO|nr:hypothetical protein [Mycolicibacter heraklionensis]KLO31503.1 hypothetical protein ABW16_01245 [Mycolicibacter heraklionensis]